MGKGAPGTATARTSTPDKVSSPEDSSEWDTGNVTVISRSSSARTPANPCQVSDTRPAPE